MKFNMKIDSLDLSILVNVFFFYKLFYVMYCFYYDIEICATEFNQSAPTSSFHFGSAIKFELVLDLLFNLNFITCYQDFTFNFLMPFQIKKNTTKIF